MGPSDTLGRPPVIGRQGNQLTAAPLVTARRFRLGHGQARVPRYESAAGEHVAASGSTAFYRRYRAVDPVRVARGWKRRGFAPNGEAVSYGLMSITGVVLWELLSTYRHRTALRAEGKRPAARPRFGLARWIWFSGLTRLAWLLTLRDGHTTTDGAWRAALAAVDRYGSTKHARNAVRSGRPVTHDASSTRDQPHACEAGTDNRRVAQPGAAAADPSRDAAGVGGGAAGDDRGPSSRPGDRDDTVVRPNRDDNPRDDDPRDLRAVDRGPGRPDDAEPALRIDELHDEVEPHTPHDRTAAGQPDPRPRDAAGPHPPSGPTTGHDARQPALAARMLTYARQRVAQGAPVSGADLDREFGTRDYGRKILRRMADGQHLPDA
jgi:hypothetical protein